MQVFYVIFRLPKCVSIICFNLLSVQSPFSCVNQQIIRVTHYDLRITEFWALNVPGACSRVQHVLYMVLLHNLHYRILVLVRPLLPCQVQFNKGEIQERWHLIKVKFKKSEIQERWNSRKVKFIKKGEIQERWNLRTQVKFIDLRKVTFQKSTEM